ncbi:MAG: hypothetical protein ABIC04_03710 [Nanoarchaeota archaeon]
MGLENNLHEKPNGVYSIGSEEANASNKYGLISFVNNSIKGALGFSIEHLVIRPFQGWALPTDRQYEQNEKMGLPRWGLAAYSIAEELILTAALFELYRPALNVDFGIEFSSYLASTLNFTKDGMINLFAVYKITMSVDLISRIFELTVWPRRPRASISGGLGYRVFCLYPNKISRNKTFQKYCTSGPGKVLSILFDYYRRKFKRNLSNKTEIR